MSEQKPKIIYIDEKEYERDNFETEAYQSKLFSEIITLGPKATLEELILSIEEYNVDGVITDFNLSDGEYCPYDGEDIVNEIFSRREYFPVFIRTAFEGEAVGKSNNVNIIYAKDEQLKGHNSFFLLRVARQIKQQAAEICSWSDRVEELLSRDAESLSESEEAELVDLDYRLQRSIDVKSATRSTSMRRHHSLLMDRINDILEKLDVNED